MRERRAMSTHRNPLNRSIAIGCVAFIIVLCILLSVANLMIYKNYVYDDYRDYITEILDYTMSRVDGDDLKKCIDTGEETDTYKETLLFMDDLMNHLDSIHYFYAVKPLNTEDTGNVMSVLSAERYQDRYVDTEGNLYLGWVSDDEYDSQTAARLLDIMNGEGIVFFEEETGWGADYTGAVPIKDSAGNGIAVLAVDIDMSFINGMILNYAATNICIISLVGIVFIAIFLIWSGNNITKPIKSLEQSAVAFADHCHGQRDIDALTFDAPEIKADNEIKALSNAVVKMATDMRDYASDIVNAEKRVASMRELAIRDSLTGIRNKTGYDNEVKRIEAKIEGGDTKVGLAIADLNFLKKVNDAFGHDKGDLAIKKLCQMVCDTFGHSAVFRIGGDEFVIVLYGSDYDGYEQLKDSLYEQFAKLAADDTVDPWEKISAAIGAAFYDESLDDNVDSLFRRADYAMYDCKKAMNAVRTS